MPDSYYFWLMVTEFFNRSVGDVHRLGPATFFEDFLPTVRAGVGSEGDVVDSRGRVVTAEYALVTCRTPIEGRLVAQAPRGALRLVRVGGPLRLSNTPGCARSQP